MSVRFVLDGQVVDLPDVDPTGTLLDLLRYRLRRTGTKEGCGEGDCGACTVLAGALDGDGLRWRAVNACILFLPMIHGKALMTVESVGRDGPSPLQQCMGGNGSSQCGFCTPGFVMSLHGRAMGAVGCDLPVADVLAGNLCRCTGYGPILAAGNAAEPVTRDDAPIVAALRAIHADAMPDTIQGGEHDGRRWFAPRTGDELAQVLAAHPDVRIVAGATDVGLWVTKGLRQLDTLVFIGDIADLARIEEGEAGVTLGAGVRYADAHNVLARLHPDLGELVRRIGGLQVRNAGTVGGNIANGSPIGDGPPALIALGAQITLRGIQGRRTMALEDYFIAYGQQDRQPDEFVETVHIPRPAPDAVIQIAKLSRRFDSDISAVCGAMALRVADGRIAQARIAFGGMAGTPKRAAHAEAALTGAPFTLATMEQAAAALAQDFAPLSDVRGSADYRLSVAGNLFRRLWLRETGGCVSVLDVEAEDV